MYREEKITTRVIRLIALLTVLLGVGLHFSGTLAAEPVRIGVLAFRPKPQTLAQWQPLAVALKQAIPERDFIIEAYSYPELNQAVASRQLNFVLTNSGHYVLLSQQRSLSSPLATLSIEEQGQAVSVFGGVVFARADAEHIATLTDLRGKTIAASSLESLGGYQMQAYELKQVGVRLPEDADLHITGMPHDNVVNEVLSGLAQAGFVRSGVLEAMAHEGKLDMAKIKILNRQNPKDIPVLVSTHLYPEWPFSALPHTEESLARRVAAALFVLEENTRATKAMNIHGFVIPADYNPVAELLRELRMPPFDTAPKFTLQDVWNRYRWQLITCLVFFGLILYLVLRLLQTNRILDGERRQVAESRMKLQTIIEAEPACVKILAPDGSLQQMNRAGLNMIEADTEEQVRGSMVADIVTPPYREAFMALSERVNQGGSGSLEFEIVGLKGGHRWLETHAVPMRDGDNRITGLLGLTRDITERRQMEEQVRLMAFYDVLTKLPNRRLINDRLSYSMAASKRGANYCALMFLDLDNFKPLNDKYGHEVGDLLLIEAADRLRNCMREIDTVGRFGGDEFVVLLNELSANKDESRLQARIVAEKISKTLSEPYRLNARRDGKADVAVEHRCTASIGVVLFTDHEANQDDLLKWADSAMYQAKEAGRNMIRFYDADILASA